MSLFGQRLTEVRESLGMKQSQFAEYLSTSPANISRYEAGEMGVALDTVADIARKVGVNPGWLIGWLDDENKYLGIDADNQNGKKIPIVGTIAAGSPILAQENIDGFDYVPHNFPATFCLRVKGDSMKDARILDGDLVYIQQQDFIEHNEIAAVLIDNEEATLKPESNILRNE